VLRVTENFGDPRDDSDLVGATHPTAGENKTGFALASNRHEPAHHGTSLAPMPIIRLLTELPH
jgi:hypothetical protein